MKCDNPSCSYMLRVVSGTVFAAANAGPSYFSEYFSIYSITRIFRAVLSELM
jgi:hypothetical protein